MSPFTLYLSILKVGISFQASIRSLTFSQKEGRKYKQGKNVLKNVAKTLEANFSNS